VERFFQKSFIILRPMYRPFFRRHLFDRYSIVFPFFSVSQRENDGKHIEKRYDKERRNIEPGRLTEERWGQICDTIGTLRKVGVTPHRIKRNFRAKRQESHRKHSPAVLDGKKR
jgi:hypothetical protein